MKKQAIIMMLLSATLCNAQGDLRLNDLEYFERQGVNVLVFSNSFNGGFNDEKNSGIEIIHHGVRTVQGGAVRLNNTPEQWDLVPKMTDRKVDKENGSIEVTMRYDDYDFESRAVVTAKGKAVEPHAIPGWNRCSTATTAPTSRSFPATWPPGLLFRKPDHFENYDDWPFLWGQNEGTIAGNTQYIIFGSSFRDIVAPK